MYMIKNRQQTDGIRNLIVYLQYIQLGLTPKNTTQNEKNLYSDRIGPDDPRR